MLIRNSKDLALMVISQRKKLNLSQTDVAKRVGLKQQTVSAFENKPSSTKLETLFYILSAVELDLAALFKNESIGSKKWKEEW